MESEDPSFSKTKPSGGGSAGERRKGERPKLWIE